MPVPQMPMRWIWFIGSGADIESRLEIDHTLFFPYGLINGGINAGKCRGEGGRRYPSDLDEFHCDFLGDFQNRLVRYDLLGQVSVVRSVLSCVAMMRPYR